MIVIVAYSTTSIDAQIAAPTPRDDLWSPNGYVAAAREHRGILYITGAFTKVGIPSGGFAITDPESGVPITGLPPIDGEINVVEPDGLGGWWIGGRIRYAGTELRGGAVHILADGTLAPWDPGLGTSVTVLDIAIDGATVFLVGTFGAMAVDSQTGQQLSWSPTFDIGPNSIEVVQDRLIVAGHFSIVDGQPREGLAAFSGDTGELLPWGPDGSPVSDGIVAAMTISEGTVYLAGQFSLPDSPLSSFVRVAAVDLASGLQTGPDIPINGGGVAVLEVIGPTLYVGGSFTQIAGVAQNSIAAIDRTTGDLEPWSPVLSSGGSSHPWVHAIAGGVQRVYVAGEFETINGQAHFGAAAFDVTTGALASWDPRTGTTAISEIRVADRTVAMGGAFTIVGAVDREYAAAIDLTTGEPTAFAPVVGSNETGIAPAGSQIHIGTGLYDAGTGQRIQGFNLSTLSFVSRLYRMDETLYAVGSGAGGSGIYALDASTGDFRWNLEGPTRVEQLTAGPDGRFLYIAGGFGSVGQNLTRPGIAEIDTLKHRFTDWSPSLDRGATDVFVSGTRVFVVGDFVFADNQLRRGLAVFDVLDEKARIISGFDAALDDPVRDIAAFGEALYIKGSFRNVGGEWRESIAAIHGTTAALCTWNVTGGVSWRPFADPGPSGLVFSGGSTRFGIWYTPYFCVFEFVPGQVCR